MKELEYLSEWLTGAETDLHFQLEAVNDSIDGDLIASAYLNGKLDILESFSEALDYIRSITPQQ